MYIVYCKHIFVYIFLCYFNWDSSFVTEVFSKLKKSPLQTEALCFSSFSVRHSGCKRLFLLICTENSNQEGREAKLSCSKAWPATLINSPACLEHRRGLPDPGWLPFKMAWIVDIPKSHFKNLPPVGWGSSPSLNTGPVGGKLNSRIRDFEAEEAAEASKLKRRWQCEKSHD